MFTETLAHATGYALEAVLVVTAADASVFAGHFLLDNFARTDRGPKFLRSIAEANALHHARPNEFLKKSIFDNSKETALIGFATVLFAWMFGVLTWHVWLYAAIAGSAATFHRFQHLPVDQVPRLIKLLQSIGLLQSRRQHAVHHRTHHQNYGILLPWTNPILEAIQVPRLAKRLLEKCCEIHALDIKRIAEALRRELKLKDIV